VRDVGMAGDGLVDDVKGTVGSLPLVVGCYDRVKNNLSVCRWVRLR